MIIVVTKVVSVIIFVITEPMIENQSFIASLLLLNRVTWVDDVYSIVFLDTKTHWTKLQKQG